MSAPGFAEGAVVALVAAMIATLAQTLLGLFLGPWAIAQLISVGLGLGYGLYLMARGPEPAGRVLLVVAWGLVSLFAGALFDGLWPQILAQLTLVWATRVFYHHSDPRAILLDLGLLLLGCAAAVWTLERTGSLFLMVWMLLLIQALFPMLTSRAAATDSGQTGHHFASAEQAAERALRRLSARH